MFLSLATLYSTWNLNFLRAIYDTIIMYQSSHYKSPVSCYRGKHRNPLVLLCGLYSVVKLHDRGSRVFATLCHFTFYFHVCSHFTFTFNLKSSLIDTFATSILLSYIKIIITAFYILSPTQLWSPDGSYEWVIYYDPSIMYFGPSHIAYAIITLILS